MCLNIFWSKRDLTSHAMLILRKTVTSIGTVYSPSVHQIALEYGVSDLVARIPQATYLLGFGVGVSWVKSFAHLANMSSACYTYTHL